MTNAWLKRQLPVSQSISSGVRAQVASSLLAIATGLVLVGCGSTSSSTPQSTAFKPEQIDVAKLPAVGDPLPPLDDGRIELAMPEKWKVGERAKGRLAWAYMKSGQSYPQIIVKVEAADDVQLLTSQELQGFESQVQEEQDAEVKEKGIQLIEKVHAIQVGDFLGVQYIRRAKDKNKSIDRLILETTGGGRRYRIEMLALVGTTLESRPIVLSVAHSLKFLNAPVEEKSAQENPAEPKPE